MSIKRIASRIIKKAEIKNYEKNLEKVKGYFQEYHEGEKKLHSDIQKGKELDRYLYKKTERAYSNAMRLSRRIQLSSKEFEKLDDEAREKYFR